MPSARTDCSTRIARLNHPLAPLCGNPVNAPQDTNDPEGQPAFSCIGFTPALIAFAPLYASYSYIVVDDTICIVDPVSYDIVGVIDEGSFETAGPPLAPLRPFCSPWRRSIWSIPMYSRTVPERSCASALPSVPRFRAASRCLPSPMP
jgi:hypothetical protein